MAVSGLIFIGVVILIAAFVWMVLLTDGTYFGKRGVRFIYQRVARIWNLDERPGRSREALNARLSDLILSIPGIENGHILDVATGTGRVPLLMGADQRFKGHVTGIDLSHNMLAKAERLVKSRGYEDKVTLKAGDAQNISFEDDSFEVVTCIETLEMFTNPRKAVTEMIRVLKPGGVLILTKATDAFGLLKPGRAVKQKRFLKELEQCGVDHIEVHEWGKSDYLVLARKVGKEAGQEKSDLASVSQQPARRGN